MPTRLQYRCANRLLRLYWRIAYRLPHHYR
jgi:hypothetical protein